MEGDRIIVIGGGVGPMAGVALHAKIIENTLTDGTDQSHLSVHHYSCSADIPDRTEYLLCLARGDSSAADPAAAMAAVFEDASLALGGRAAVGGVPCNTFHAPAIFGRFMARVAETCPSVRVVNMLDETVSLLRERLVAAGARIGVLSTTGTRQSGVYAALLSAAGYEAAFVSDAEQEALHAAIYDRTWGIKASSPPSSRATETVATMAAALLARGARAVILACTELPLALPGVAFQGLPLVDPVLALARALIREAAPDKLKPFG